METQSSRIVSRLCVPVSTDPGGSRPGICGWRVFVSFLGVAFESVQPCHHLLSHFILLSGLCCELCVKMDCCGGGLTDEERQAKRKNKVIEQQLKKERVEFKSTHRLLLLGNFSYLSSSSFPPFFHNFLPALAIPVFKSCFHFSLTSNSIRLTKNLLHSWHACFVFILACLQCVCTLL